MEATSLLAAGV